MNIKNIIITVHSEACYEDEIELETNLPNIHWPYFGNLKIRFRDVHGDGENYVKHYFPGVSYQIEQVYN